MAGCGGSCSITETQDEEQRDITVSVGKDSIISTVHSGKHEFLSDETKSWGGEDSYPDPWDYIIGGLGSCIAITIRQYATKHFIQLEKAEITLTYHYDEFAEGSPYIINKSIEFFGNISDEEKERLLSVSNSPAQKMLTRGVKVITS